MCVFGGEGGWGEGITGRRQAARGERPGSGAGGRVGGVGGAGETLSRSRFSGLRSRYTMSWLWRYSITDTTHAPKNCPTLPTRHTPHALFRV